jgi:hypothetical protein
MYSLLVSYVTRHRWTAADPAVQGGLFELPGSVETIPTIPSTETDIEKIRFGIDI